MRIGGGHAKGSAFERLVNTQLSLWLTQGARADLFRRNVLSGGSFTQRARRADPEAGMPGDLSANHPLAFAFLGQVAVECKHHHQVQLAHFLLEARRTSFLMKTYYHTCDQAAPLGLIPWVVAKEDRRPAFILMPGEIGHIAAMCPNGRVGVMYHTLFTEAITLIRLDEWTRHVDPQTFVRALTERPRQ